MAKSRVVGAIADRLIPNSWLNVTQGAEFVDFYNMIGQVDPITASYQDVCDFGDITLIDSRTPVELFMSSSDSNDKGNVVRVTGLDSSGDIKTMDARLNSSDAQIKKAVIGGAAWTKVFRLELTTVQALRGDVYCYLNDTVVAGVPQTQSKIQAKAVQGYDSSFNGTFTVPTGKRAILLRAYNTQASGVGQAVRLMIRESGGVFRVAAVDDRHLTMHDLDFAVPFTMAAGSDLKAQALSLTSTNPISVVVPMILLDAA